MRHVRIEPEFESWRAAARALLQERVAPPEVLWDDGTEEMLLPRLVPTWAGERRSGGVTLPKRFVALAERVSAHRDRGRWQLLYRAAFRILFENRELLDLVVDDDIRRLGALDSAVRRDLHQMHAFVRFRQSGDRFVAWYAPAHRIVPLAAPFFVERFRSMQWSILTPDASLHWDGTELTYGPGVPRDRPPGEDELEELWRTYYASVFNPARTNLQKMRADMPSRAMRELPELRGLARLVTGAAPRVGSMLDAQRRAPTAAPFVPATADLERLRAAAAACEGCELHHIATRTVFGEGPHDARVMLVGEQPGDQEDLGGRPFIGPAGEVLDRALAAAGLDRGALYVTNAVKHFAHIERGKARIHRTPKALEVTACRPWLDAELRAVAPSLIVTLGSTATRALLGARVQLLRDHGRFFPLRAAKAEVVPTLHPSAVLRAPGELAAQYFATLVNDLTRVAERREGAGEASPLGVASPSQ